MAKGTPNGVVLYRGPSLLDGEPIVCVATGLVCPSTNRKTGNMVQCHVLVGGQSPVDALRNGADRSVCGDCLLRPQVGADGKRKPGSCYVVVWRAPQTVWRTYQEGGYPSFQRDRHLPLFAGRAVRLGAYGDPAAVPLAVWLQVTAVAANWTGYTHQWRTCDRAYSGICMASCETVEDRRLAMALGYRAFRARLPEQTLDDGEFICPASTEANHRLTCDRCKACSGGKSGGRNASPAIVVVGSRNVATYRDMLDRLARDPQGRVSLL